MLGRRLYGMHVCRDATIGDVVAGCQAVVCWVVCCSTLQAGRTAGPMIWASHDGRGREFHARCAWGVYSARQHGRVHDATRERGKEAR